MTRFLMQRMPRCVPLFIAGLILEDIQVGRHLPSVMEKSFWKQL